MNYIEEFKRRCKDIDRNLLSRNNQLKRVWEPLNVYRVIRCNGHEHQAVAWNLTLKEAERFLEVLRTKPLQISRFNNINRPYFELERDKIDFERINNS